MKMWKKQYKSKIYNYFATRKKQNLFIEKEAQRKLYINDCCYMIIMWIVIPDIVLQETMVLAKADFDYPPTYSMLIC